MLTAAITAAVAAVLSLFGVKPGAYLVGVAIGVKLVVVACSLMFGARLLKRRAAIKGQVAAEAAAKTPPDPERAGTG
ncbi:MAG: hypothetical protein ABJA82_08700 [Myxococcales bacterium]